MLGLELHAAANLAANAAARAVIETVAGDEVWQGPLSASTDPNGAAVGRVEAPLPACARTTTSLSGSRLTLRVPLTNAAATSSACARRAGLQPRRPPGARFLRCRG